MTNQTPSVADYVHLRADQQFSRLYLHIFTPEPIFSCRVASAPSSNDLVLSIRYDQAIGDLTDIQDGMSVYIGTSAGAFDKGVVRTCGKTPTTDYLFIGETSKVTWSVGDYVTVMNDPFGIWQRKLTTYADGTFLVDGHLEYTNQHAPGHFRPVPHMLTHAVGWIDPLLEYAEVLFDSNGSWAAGGTTLGSPTWYFPGASQVDLTDPTRPVVQYDTPGNYVASLEHANSHGETAWGHRAVFIHDKQHPPIRNFSIRATGDWLRGGWRGRITVYETLPAIPTNSLVVISCENYYNGAAAVFGPLPHRENILLAGYTKGASITSAKDGGSTVLNFFTPDGILATVPAWTTGYLNTTSTPTKWTQLQGMDPTQTVFAFLSERTSLLQVTDVFSPNCATKEVGQNVSVSKLWGQLEEYLFSTVRYKPICDRFGRLFMEPDVNLLPLASRSTIPISTTLQDGDYQPDQQIVAGDHPVSRVILSGISTPDGVAESAVTYYSLSPGHAKDDSGDDLPVDNLRLTSQAEANSLAGCIFSAENLPFTVEELVLTGNNPFIDIAPQQRVDHTLHAERNPEGLEFSGHMLPRQVALSYASGKLNWSLALSPEVDPAPAIKGDIPGGPSEPPIEISEIPPLPPLPPVPPPPVPPSSEPRDIIAVLVSGYGLYWTSFADGFYTWHSANGGFTSTQKAGLQRFVMGKTGYIYAATTREVFSLLAGGAGSKTTIGSQSFFLGYVPDTTANYEITALGIDYKSPSNLAVIASRKWPDYGAATFRLAGNSLVHMASPGLKIENSFAYLTFYGGYWYLTSNFDVLFATSLIRIKSDLATLDNILGIAGPYPLGHVHAREADYIYAVDQDLHRITALGSTISANYAGVAGSIDCDPTGQYVMRGYNGTPINLKLSSDYGASFSTISSLPAVNVCENIRVLNMGDSLKWLVTYTESAGGPVTTQRIYRTVDGGTTWTSCVGNLFSVGAPSTAIITAVQYA